MVPLQCRPSAELMQHVKFPRERAQIRANVSTDLLESFFLHRQLFIVNNDLRSLFVLLCSCAGSHHIVSVDIITLFVCSRMIFFLLNCLLFMKWGRYMLGRFFFLSGWTGDGVLNFVGSCPGILLNVRKRVQRGERQIDKKLEQI